MSGFQPTHPRPAHARRATFDRNRALSAGGAALTQVERGGTLRSSRFVGNAGLPVDLPRLAEGNCGRDYEGGGGALCVHLLQSVFLVGCELDGNTAVNGGGMFLQQRCVPGGVGCGPAVLQVSGVSRVGVYRGGGGGRAGGKGGGGRGRNKGVGRGVGGRRRGGDRGKGLSV